MGMPKMAFPSFALYNIKHSNPLTTQQHIGHKQKEGIPKGTPYK